VQPRKRGRLWGFEAAVWNVYDSNINHDQPEVESFGIVYGVEAHFQNRGSDPSFEIDYDVARHAYTNTDRWDRISHEVKMVYEFDLARAWSLDLEGEVSIKGSSEDRELADQYVVRPVLKWRLTKQNSVDFYAAYRLKRYDPIDAGRNSTNRYAGFEFEQSVGSHRLDLGFRYETNDAEAPRSSYIRWTYSADYTIPLGPRHSVSFETRYRPQRYPYRLVELDDEDTEVPRFDKRWVFTVLGIVGLADHIDLIPRYRYETRSSNDPEKGFGEHLPSLAVRYRW